MDQPARSIDWQTKLARRARRLKPSAIRAVSQFANEPGVISFASGSPNPDFFPQASVRDAVTEIMSDPARREVALQYGPSEGYPPLRALIAERMGCGPECVLVTNGSQQGLSLIAALLLEPGDRVIITEPTYLGALQAFSLGEPEYVSVSMRGDGLDLAALERAFASGAKFMYVMPDFGNPTGMVLPVEQRRLILDLARRHGVPVVEDQAYAQLRFSGERRPTLFEWDRACVIYAGTFSKSLAPGLRVGWLAAPPELMTKLVSLKQASDLHVANLTQTLVYEVVRAAPPEQAEALRAGYRAQRDAMLTALDRHMPPGATWTRPEGGMFIWLTLPDGLDAQVLLRAAMAREKVLFVPGAPFFTDGSGLDTVRLSFSLVPPDQIETGIERLGRAVRRCLQDRNLTREEQQ